MWFILGIIPLTIVYIALTAAICYGLAVYYEREEDVEAKFWAHIKNNNTWFWMLLGASTITFIIACFNFGPAVLLPESLPTKEQREVTGNVLDHLLHGKNAPAKSVSKETLPWATGTWFWWKAWLFYAIVLVFYTPFALHDELIEFIKGFKRIVDEHNKKKYEEIHGPPPTPPAAPAAAGHAAATTTPTPTTKVSFWKLLSVEFIGELMAEFAVHFLKKGSRP